MNFSTQNKKVLQTMGLKTKRIRTTHKFVELYPYICRVTSAVRLSAQCLCFSSFHCQVIALCTYLRLNCKRGALPSELYGSL